jgi:hypothetical protein
MLREPINKSESIAFSFIYLFMHTVNIRLVPEGEKIPHPASEPENNFCICITKLFLPSEC